MLLRSFLCFFTLCSYSTFFQVLAEESELPQDENNIINVEECRTLYEQALADFQTAGFHHKELFIAITECPLLRAVQESKVVNASKPKLVNQLKDFFSRVAKTAGNGVSSYEYVNFVKVGLNIDSIGVDGGGLIRMSASMNDDELKMYLQSFPSHKEYLQMKDELQEIANKMGSEFGIAVKTCREIPLHSCLKFIKDLTIAFTENPSLTRRIGMELELGSSTNQTKRSYQIEVGNHYTVDTTVMNVNSEVSTAILSLTDLEFKPGQSLQQEREAEKLRSSFQMRTGHYVLYDYFISVEDRQIFYKYLLDKIDPKKSAHPKTIELSYDLREPKYDSEKSSHIKINPYHDQYFQKVTDFLENKGN